MHFRPASPSDAESIAALHAQSWQRTYRGMMPDDFLDGPVVPDRLAVWRHRLSERRADRAVILAVEEGQVAGFVCLVGGEDPVWGSYIDNLHVTPGFQRTGVGTSLMAHGASWLEREYADRAVYLWVMESNRAARRFYDRLGARNAEAMVKSDPGGGTALNCRYIWADPAGLLQGVGRSVARCGPSTGESNKALIRRWLHAADEGFPTDFLSFFSPDYRGHLGGRVHMDLNELMRLERAFASGFNPIIRSIEDLIESGDKVILRLTTTARHSGEWQGIPATDRTVTFTAMVIYRLVNERIMESWGEVDFAGLWRQLNGSKDQVAGGDSRWPGR